MHPSIEPVAQLYQASDNLYQKALGGLDREQALRRPGEQSNPLLWIAGHLAWTRVRLCRMLGTPVEFAWPETFARGAHLGDMAALPSPEEIEQAWREVSERLMKRLDELTDADLAAAAPRPFPIADRTIRGAITFLAYHEGYHVGQMSFLRKWLGYPGLVDG
jgi:hypothetical protein